MVEAEFSRKFEKVDSFLSHIPTSNPPLATEIWRKESSEVNTLSYTLPCETAEVQ